MAEKRICPKCGKRTVWQGACYECGFEVNAKGSKKYAGMQHGADMPSPSPLSVVFFILSALSLIGGLILFSQFWPGTPRFGYEWKITAYQPAILWLMLGILEAALFAAIAQVLIYLKGILINTGHKSAA